MLLKTVLLTSAAALGPILVSPAVAQTIPASGGTASAQTAPVSPAETDVQRQATSTNPVTADSPAPAGTAAPTAAPEANTAGDIVVTGFRQSLQNAARIKRNSAQIQDSIVAEDIGKLPDTNIAETLQRVPGVQILRNARGEGNGYAVHGLTQVQTVLNGRGVFSTSNRSASLLDLSADILAGIDVYKTATADQIEGGLGGLINVRTARPFDFSGQRLVASASGNYSTIRNKAEPRLAALASHRWNTGIGELGLLVGVTYEKVTTGAYDTNTNAYTSRTDLYDVDGNGTTGNAGDAVLAPTQVQARYTYGDRTRFTVTTSGQWKPTDNLSFYVDGLYAYSNGRSATQGLAAQTQASTAAKAVAPFTFESGTNIPATATYTNALLVSSVGATTNPYRIYQGAFGGTWDIGHLKLSGEVSYTESGGPFYSRTINLNARAPSVTIKLNGNTPDLAVSGVDLTNPASYTYASFSDLRTYAYGREPVIRGDATYDFGGGPLKSLAVGVRYVDHVTITDTASANYSTSNSSIAAPLATVTSLTPDDLFSGKTSSLNQWLGVSIPILQDPATSRSTVGVNTADPANAITSHYRVHETVLAGYAMANFGFSLGSLPIDGNIGLRALHTSSNQLTYQATNGVVGPVTGTSAYDNYLPSLNIRASFTPDLFLRLAYSKAITRPNYGDLSPAFTLSPSTGTGSGGNPDLTPVRANQYDASLEYYFGRSNLVAVSLFKKDVSGFVQNFAADETYGGVVYRVSRPRNGGDGEIKGFEVNYQQFFDFLPGLLSGLGVQGNYTFVDSAITNLSINRTAPAENLSKHSYNITGIYEKGPVSLRLAYNWRGRYVATTSADAAGRPLYVAALPQLDLSATYALTDRISLKLDAVNLTNTFRYMYYQDPSLPQIANQFDRSVEAGVRVRF